ncbi:Hypothetical protein HVR_LOCUS170 [uncultured virus]|nr:Hypothetical protein HVR_LOCUS170 [uncultured virus]
MRFVERKPAALTLSHNTLLTNTIMGIYYYFYNQTADQSNKLPIPGFGKCYWIDKFNDAFSEDEMKKIFRSIIEINKWDETDAIYASADYPEYYSILYHNGTIEYVDHEKDNYEEDNGKIGVVKDETERVERVTNEKFDGKIEIVIDGDERDQRYWNSYQEKSCNPDGADNRMCYLEEDNYWANLNAQEQLYCSRGEVHEEDNYWANLNAQEQLYCSWEEVHEEDYDY